MATTQRATSLRVVKKTRATARSTGSERAPLEQASGTWNGVFQRLGQCLSELKPSPPVIEVLNELANATGRMQDDALKARVELSTAEQRVGAAEIRIQQLEQELARIGAMVMRDPLTGTLNRAGFDDVYIRESARADRRNSPLSLIVLDLDDFKLVNDMHGHDSGDAALVHLVAQARRTLRPNDLLVRYGGEEFLILLPDATANQAATVGARLQRALRSNPLLLETRKLIVSFSAGVAQRRIGEPQGSIVRRADRAMYQAKAAGKARVILAPDADSN